MPERLFLEDLAAGQRFVSAARTVSAEEIKEFAARYDPQPFHLDDAAAMGTLFGGLAASGWHTAALTMRMVIESVPMAGGIIGTGGELSLAAADPARGHAARRDRGAGDHALALAAGAGDGGRALHHAEPERRGGADLYARRSSCRGARRADGAGGRARRARAHHRGGAARRLVDRGGAAAGRRGCRAAVGCGDRGQPGGDAGRASGGRGCLAVRLWLADVEPGDALCREPARRGARLAPQLLPVGAYGAGHAGRCRG